MRKALPIILTALGAALLVFALMSRETRKASSGVDMFTGERYSRGPMSFYPTQAKTMGALGAGLLVAGGLMLRRF